MLKRSIETILKTALKISPVVLLKGARQVGKSTLALELNQNYIVLDDVSTRLNAKDDPNRFIETLEKPVTIDEIQKVPELLESLKIYIDKERNNGDFLITGSANILDMKETKDTLAGRIIEIDLYPLSIKERANKADENIVDRLFAHDFSTEKIATDRIVADILRGGYPDVQELETPLEKKLWVSSYVSTYIERDARDLGDFRDMDSFFRFVNIIAPRSTTLLNKSKIAKEVGVRVETCENYLVILEQTFQLYTVRPFFENIGKRFVKSPKIFLNDTGIMSYFLGIYTIEQFEKSSYKGALVETFVFNELLKHIGFTMDDTQIYHYLTSDKKEIDFILQRNNEIIAIEVKSSSKVGKDDFRYIMDYQKNSSKNVFGIVLYMGENVLHINEQCVALPLGYFY
ncbi:MAG: Putative AAA ATPase [uncultured Sulfurovum sp.]|uniref:AAA ATPase n=1 Tax=uncultured Sulfurovum sp. TaxID=269237 RepID=A0A6S6SB11_9BACT|nr:MAG: Putative AAA ATPase [uncultured Sulfurovum sp.]